MDDLISRQQAIDAIVQCTNCGDEDTLREYVLKHSLDNGWTGGILEALDAVKDLPPAQPEPKEGHWILYDKRFSWRTWYKCSECGNYLDFSGVNGGRVEPHFCPNCGAKMTISTK